MPPLSLYVMDYFEFYGLPLSFQVDEGTLRQIYLRNSRRYHPDFHTLADAAQQEEMLRLSSLNNEAFLTLSDPDRRIRYVLERKGLLGEEGRQPALPPAFLMDMMDINEGLMELEADPDPARYEEIRLAVNDLEQQLLEQAGPALQAYSEPGGLESDLLTVRDYFLKRRYLLRILENLSKFAPR